MKINKFFKDKKFKHVYITFLALLAFALVPLFIDVNTSYIAYFLFMFFLLVIIAQGWNLVAGYTGQISLAQNAFFGIGAYTTALIWSHDITKTGYYFDPVVMILSGLVPALLATIMGLVLLSRLRGDYFSFGTLGVGQIIYVIFLQVRGVTGGADGIRLPSTVFKSMFPYYYTGLLLALFATVLVYFIVRSRIGHALRAIREDEVSAASHGVNILKFKIIAFATGAFLAGLSGNLLTYYLFTINPDSVLNLNWLLYPILACVLGGNGTILGPVIGAFFVTVLFTYGGIYFPQFHPIVTGVLIIVVMKFMPSGIIGLRQGRGKSGK